MSSISCAAAATRGVKPPRLELQPQSEAEQPKNCYLHGLGHDIDLHIDILLARWGEELAASISRQRRIYTRNF